MIGPGAPQVNPRDRLVASLPAPLREFIHGLTRSSLAALAGIVLVALGWLALAVTTLTEGFMAGRGYGMLMTSPSDEYAYLTHRSLRYGLEPPAEPMVVLIGSSNLREAITDEPDIEQRLEAETGRRFSAAVMAAGGLTHWDAMMLLDQFRGGARGIVLLEISSRMLARGRAQLTGTYERPRLALRSPTLEDEATRVGSAARDGTGSYFVDFRRFFLARPKAMANALSGAPRRKLHMTDTWRPPTDAEWEGRIIPNAGRWVSEYAEHSRANLDAIERLIVALRDGWWRVAIVVAQDNPRVEREVLADQAAANAMTAFRADLDDLSRRAGTPVWWLREPASLAEADYFDHTHLIGPEPRARFTEALCERLAVLWNQTGDPSDG